MKATKLKSGRYRARAYDYQDPDGKQHFKSFTADTKKEAELLATQYELNKKPSSVNKNITVGEAIDNYISQNKDILSPTTISRYKQYRKYSFPDLMDIKICKLDNLLLRDSVTKELQRVTRRGTTIKAKTLHGEYSLIKTAVSLINKNIDFNVPMPRIEKNIVNLPTPEEIYNAVKGSDIELPVLLAMWLSFSFSEIKGLKHSSITGDYITINQVRVMVDNELVEKKLAKVDTRTRRHHIPPYIHALIDQIPPSQEYLVELTHSQIRRRLERILRENNIQTISFHKLRHISASTMELLRIPDKYKMERGGWSTDSTMKQVYTHTFSQERVEADKKIDQYFENIIDNKKIIPSYNEFITYMKIDDTPDAMEIYNRILKL